MSDAFAYWAELTQADGSLVQLDLEEHGWAEPERLAQARAFTIVPKDTNSRWPFIRVHVPEGAKPIFKSRPIMNLKPFGVELFRAYAVGWFKDGESHWTWAFPNGSIETETDNPTIADLLAKSITDKMMADALAAQEAAKAAEQEEPNG
jgi:hypothetical protein